MNKIFLFFVVCVCLCAWVDGQATCGTLNNTPHECQNYYFETDACAENAVCLSNVSQCGSAPQCSWLGGTFCCPNTDTLAPVFVFTACQCYFPTTSTTTSGSESSMVVLSSFMAVVLLLFALLV